jgi:hypothetical protein
MASTRDRDREPGRRRSPGFDPTHIDLTDFDVVRVIRGTVDASGSLAARATELAKDATYVTVGLGLLGYQRVQVRRRELERSRRQ